MKTTRTRTTKTSKAQNTLGLSIAVTARKPEVSKLSAAIDAAERCDATPEQIALVAQLAVSQIAQAEQPKVASPAAMQPLALQPSPYSVSDAEREARRAAMAAAKAAAIKTGRVIGATW